MANLTRACTCDSDGEEVPGRQVCGKVSGWKACECAEMPETLATGTGGIGPFTDPAANHNDENFFWARTVPSGGACEPGHYQGVFDGGYNPAVTLGFSTILVAGDVGFDLAETSTGEFFEISGGYMKGLALNLYPFEGEIHGTLDCSTGYFDGFLKNCFYNVFGINYFFEGIIRADYDKFNQAFVNGVWAVTEKDAAGNFPPAPDARPSQPLPPLPPLGGVGKWSSTWIP
jgi:hypothetical protein